MSKLAITLGAAALSLVTMAGTAHAFCGFYVSGSEKPMYADATQVTLMRDGTRTVLAMQNDYKGPLDDFALVIPVPVVLKEKDVKTLPKDVFERVDQQGAPRLVEYWEQDPCYIAPPRRPMMAKAGMTEEDDADEEKSAKKNSVKIEEKFDVAEYKILILSAKDSTGLETWLTENKYKVPDKAAPLLRPYVEGGSKFFVAKVDAKKVKMVDGRAELSPLRFTYDSEEFTLPIRLGMANSAGTQDLIVNIISPDKRFEVANYKNVFVPTNFDVKDGTRKRFAEFYGALFDKTVEKNPGAVITEYAWAATPYGMCDPCPPQPMQAEDLMTLGGDIIGGKIAQSEFTLTRLHARYSAKDMKDDLRFREAKPVTGGREQWNGKGIEYGATPSSDNAFQARYVIRHYWQGKIACKNPQRGRWGGPWNDQDDSPIAASKLAYVPRGKLALDQYIGRDLWEIGVKKYKPAPTPAPPTMKTTPPGGKAMGFGAGALAGLAVLCLSRRRRRVA